MQSMGLFTAGMLGFVQLVEAEHKREVEAKRSRMQQLDGGCGEDAVPALPQGGSGGQ